MHIVQIIDTVRFGGAQKMQLTLAEAIQPYGIQLSLISLEENIQESHFPEQLCRLGVQVHYFPASSLLDRRRLRQISHFLKQNKVDLVHTHLTYANIVGTISARLASVPVIASFRNSSTDAHPLRAFLETLLMRYVAVERMAVGQATAAAHEQRMHGRSIVPIPNAVTLLPQMKATERDKLRERLVGDATRPLTIAVGRLMTQKGYFDLIEAFDLVRQKQSNAALLIVGKGELRDAIEAEIKARALQKNIFLLGSRTDVPDLLAASDLYISASHWEGLSNALLEAMSVGLPVVATAVNDTPNVVIPSAGLLVPAKQPRALADAILTFLADDEKRLQAGQVARQHIASEFSPDSWIKTMFKLYQSVLPAGWNTAVQEQIA